MPTPEALRRAVNFYDAREALFAPHALMPLMSCPREMCVGVKLWAVLYGGRVSGHLWTR